MAWARHGHGMASVNQTRPHCVNQMGKTHSTSKPLVAWHGRGTAWARHGHGMDTACYVWIGLNTVAQLDSIGRVRSRTHKRVPWELSHGGRRAGQWSNVQLHVWPRRRIRVSISPILCCLSDVKRYKCTSHTLVSTCTISKPRAISADVTYVSPLVTGHSLLHALTFEDCALLGYNAASSGNLLPTFRDNV